MTEFHVAGNWLAVLQVIEAWVKQELLISERLAIGAIPEPKIVSKTNAVTRITSAATISTKVVDIPFCMINYYIFKV